MIWPSGHQLLLERSLYFIPSRFLLAALQINNVLSQHSRWEMENSLKVLPKGLWANFDVTMDRINGFPYEHQLKLCDANSTLDQNHHKTPEGR